jgi:hypothetical protein
MDSSSSSGVDSASYSAEYGNGTNGVTRMGGLRRKSRSSRAGQYSNHISSRAGGKRRRKTKKSRKSRKTHRRR